MPAVGDALIHTGRMRDDTAAGTTSLELTFDADAEARVRAEWEALAAAGFSSLAAHRAPSNRPHVTLVESRDPVPDPLPLDLDDALGLPLPLVLGPPLLFGVGDRRVLARAVAPTAALIALHSALRVAAGISGGDGDRPDHAWPDHLRPGRWTPHVTLSRRLRLVDLPAALALLGEPIEAHAVTLRRWEAATSTLTVVAGLP